MDNNMKQEDGMTLAEVLKAFWHRKIVFLIATITVLLIVTIGIFCVYNPRKADYQAEFCYSGLYREADGKYIDGRSFNYYDIVSRENVDIIVKDNEKYQSIDVDALFASNRLTITKKKITEEEKQENELTKSDIYVISMPKKYFKNDDIARAFAKDLIELPVVKMEETISKLKYDAYLESFKNAVSYDDQLGCLENQSSLIAVKYSELINTYGDVIVQDDEISGSLSMLSNDFKSFVKEIKLSSLLDEELIKGYVKDFVTEKKMYDIEKDRLTKQIIEIEAIITQLKVMYNDLVQQANGNLTSEAFTPITSEITKEIVLLSQANKELEEVNIKIATIEENNKEDSVNFGIRLENIADKMRKQTDKLTMASQYVTKMELGVKYVNTSIINVSNTFGKGKTLGIALASAIVIGSIAVGISFLYKPKANKEE